MGQIVLAFTEKEFTDFQRQPVNNLYVACMTQYLENKYLNVAFSPAEIKNCLAEVISSAGIKQVHIAETEKYAHATYFFNALIQHPFPGENDILIQSDKNATENPAMKAREITDRVITELNKDECGFILVNFANQDMLSHMGNFANVVKGIEILDGLIREIQIAVMAKNGVLIVTADHGNAEALTYKSSGESETKHNDNPVPFYLIGKEFEGHKSDEDITSTMNQPSGLLSDIAPTVLELMSIEKPAEMTGESLLKILSPNL